MTKPPRTESEAAGRRSIPMLGAIVGCLVAAALLTWWLLPFVTGSRFVLTKDWVQVTVASFGVLGPLAVILLTVLAIVVSPIPSGPIAIVAGMMYGTVIGACLVIIGAWAGALIAFSLARVLGLPAIVGSSNPVLRFITAPRSQPALMAVVFASRLVPFISFDAVSYAAGVTSLTFLNFALATLLGILPICFALSAVGAGLLEPDVNLTSLALLAGGITGVPLLVGWVWTRATADREE